MLKDRWYPRVRSDGRYIISGNREICLDSWDLSVVFVWGQGATHVWLDDDRVLSKGHDNVTWIVQVWTGERIKAAEIGANDIAASDGRFALAHGFDDTLYPSFGPPQHRARKPALAGQMFAYVQLGNTDEDDRTIQVIGLDAHGQLMEVARGKVGDPDVTWSGYVAWRDDAHRIWGRTPEGKESCLSVDDTKRESEPVLIDTPEGVYILTQSQGRCLLRPWKTPQVGHVVATGTTDNPHGVCVDGLFLIVFTVAGVLEQREIPLNATRENLVALPTSQPIVPIGRPCWCGFFTFGRHDPLPGNCDLRDDLGLLVRHTSGAVVAQYVAAEADGTVEGLERAIAAARKERPTVPVVAYVPRGMQSGRLPVGADYIGLEAYRGKDESLEFFERRVRASVEKVEKL